MPFDNELVLLDGLVDLDASHSQPTSLTRNDDGAVALDLKEMGAKGLSVVVICTGELVAGTAVADAAAVGISIQASDSLTFTQNTSESLGLFGDLVGSGGTGGENVIYGANTPIVVIRRITTTKRYIRAYCSIGSGHNMGVVHILVSPYPFNVL